MMDLNKLIQLVPLLAYYPSWLQWVVAIVIAAILATIFLLAMFLPQALKAKKRTIRIEFADEAPFVDKSLLRIDNSNRRWIAYFYRVQLVNTSEESTVRVRHLKLTNLEELRGSEFKSWKNTEDLILEWDSTKLVDIPPGGDVLAQFARVFPPKLQRLLDENLTGSNDVPQFRFTVPPDSWPMKMISKVPPGTHRFKLTVYFENAPPVAARFELKCPSEQGRDSVEAMLKETKIRML